MSVEISQAAPQPIEGYTLDERMPLHQMAERRMRKNKDLKIIITARNAALGVGKTTLAAWLALAWNPLFTGQEWDAKEQATLDVHEFMDQYRDLPGGSVLILDEAEQLDARRSMASENVDFSHDWMMMRVRQIISVLTLPSVSALDSRLEELADIWINVHRRGKAVVHKIIVDDYSKQVQTPKLHELHFPNVSEHEQMQRLDEMKEKKIDEKVEKLEEEEIDPDEVKRAEKIRIAQRLRDSGMSTTEIPEKVGMSKGWVIENTEAPEDDDT